MSIASDNTMTESVHTLVAALPRHGHPFGRRDIPANGIYVFFESGENAVIEDRPVERIVRVGTHRGEGRLARRLGHHFSGDRRASDFRLHLGGALLRRDAPGDPRLTTWVSNNGAPIPDVEASVTDLLRERFSFACIQVDDVTERQELQRALIGLLARFPLGPPSPDWLGRHAFRAEIRRSGLWNTQHVDAEPLDPGGFDRLARHAHRE
jgi:hypothetical protein